MYVNTVFEGNDELIHLFETIKENFTEESVFPLK